jgi:hypothetical protein
MGRHYVDCSWVSGLIMVVMVVVMAIAVVVIVIVAVVVVTAVVVIVCPGANEETRTEKYKNCKDQEFHGDGPRVGLHAQR